MKMAVVSKTAVLEAKMYTKYAIPLWMDNLGATALSVLNCCNLWCTKTCASFELINPISTQTCLEEYQRQVM